MAQTIRVSLAGTNVLTETDPNKFALKADDSGSLIKEQSRGTSTKDNTENNTISHGLGYVPMCLVWGEDENGNLIYGVEKVAFDTEANMWRVTITSSQLVITQLVDLNDRAEKHFIFYDLVA